MNKEKYMFSKPKDTNNAGKGDKIRFVADKEYKKNYDEFYNNDVKNNIESFDNVFMYDSGKENIMNVEGGCYWV